MSKLDMEELLREALLSYDAETGTPLEVTAPPAQVGGVSVRVTLRIEGEPVVLRHGDMLYSAGWEGVRALVRYSGVRFRGGTDAPYAMTYSEEAAWTQGSGRVHRVVNGQKVVIGGLVFRLRVRHFDQLIPGMVDAIQFEPVK